MRKVCMAWGGLLVVGAQCTNAFKATAAFKHLALEKREKLDMYGELLFALEKCDCQPCKFSVTEKNVGYLNPRECGRH